MPLWFPNIRRHNWPLLRSSDSILARLIAIRFDMATIADELRQWAGRVDRLDISWLLQYVLKVNAAFLVAHPDYMLTAGQTVHLHQLLGKRIAGVPVAYLIGRQGFYDFILEVTPDVLIPRPETELLVETALTMIPVNHVCKILDLGTGSGAIAIAIARYRPCAQVIALDISTKALMLARKNAARLSVRNIDFVASNWYASLDGVKFDGIVSNPPYIASEDPHLQQGDLRFEPVLALAAESDGLSCLRKIISDACRFLRQDGWLLFEHGYDQAAACSKLLTVAGFSDLISKMDFAQIDRVSGGYNRRVSSDPDK
ncbi:MAG: peptide chain release factor N(5)-glutamine methyltransferase [Nitrosomonas sp.]|nr:peptide chain release factor N(5)-glutamine methyltransferase [Nitrosomonas sp.]